MVGAVAVEIAVPISVPVAVSVAIQALIFAAVKALLLMHHSVRILIQFFPDFRMLLKVLLQINVVSHELLAIHQRRIFAKLFSELGMSVEKAIKRR